MLTQPQPHWIDTQTHGFAWSHFLFFSRTHVLQRFHYFFKISRVLIKFIWFENISHCFIQITLLFEYFRLFKKIVNFIWISQFHMFDVIGFQMFWIFKRFHMFQLDFIRFVKFQMGLLHFSCLKKIHTFCIHFIYFVRTSYFKKEISKCFGRLQKAFAYLICFDLILSHPWSLDTF